MIIPEFWISSYGAPVAGLCNGRPFHRVARYPSKSLLDEGLPGVVHRAICPDCGKHFKNGVFEPIAQPNALKETA